MSLQTVYVVLGTIIAAGVLARGLWRIVGAVHDLIKAITDNTTQTQKLSKEVLDLRESTHAQLDHAIERIARLEGGHGERQAVPDPQRQIGRGGGPGPHRGRGLGSV